MTIEETENKKRKANKNTNYYYYKEKGRINCGVCNKSIYCSFIESHQNTKRCQKIKEIIENINLLTIYEKEKRKIIDMILNLNVTANDLNFFQGTLLEILKIGCLWDETLKAWTIPNIINYNDINKLIQLNKHHNINIVALNKKGEEIEKEIEEHEILNHYINLNIDNFIKDKIEVEIESEPEQEQESESEQEPEPESELNNDYYNYNNMLNYFDYDSGNDESGI